MEVTQSSTHSWTVVLVYVCSSGAFSLSVSEDPK